MKNENFPDFIYIDTNSLYSLSTGKSSVTDFLELKKFCDDYKISIAIPFIVFSEWFKLLKDKLVSQKSKITESLNWINQQLDLNLSDPQLPKNTEAVLFKKIQKILTEMGIIVIKNTDKYSLEKILGFAVNKIKPFEQNDKGLRDSIILLTIIDHLNSNNHKRAILITNDDVFYSDGIEEHANKNNVKVSFYRTYRDTYEDLQKVLKVKVNEFVKKHSEKIINYLIENSNFIYKYIVKNAKVSEDFLKGNSFLQIEDNKLFGDISKINSIKPLKISSAYPSLLRKRENLPENYEYITFTVETEFNLIYRPFLPWNKPTFSLSNPKEFENLKSTYASYYGNPIETTIKRDISVEAKLERKGNHYNKIIFIRVLSF